VAADAVAAILALSMPTERTAAAAESAALPFLRIYLHMHHRQGSKSGATQPVYRSYAEAMAAMVKSRPAATAAASSSGAHSKTPPPHLHPVAQLTAALAHLRADGVVKLVEPSVFAARGAALVGGGVDGPCYTVALAHMVTSQVTQQPADTHAAARTFHPPHFCVLLRVFYPSACPRVCFVCFVCFVSLSQRRIALRDVVAGRYGEGSARIVELLRAQMHTEQQHVAEKAIMPAREARVRVCAVPVSLPSASSSPGLHVLVNPPNTGAIVPVAPRRVDPVPGGGPPAGFCAGVHLVLLVRRRA
jgi:hypothetical protein